MNLTRLTKVTSSADEVTLTFADGAGHEHSFTIQPAAVRPIADALVRLLARVAPAPGLAFDVVTCEGTPGGQGLALTDRDGLRVTLLLRTEEAAVAVASTATDVAARGKGRVH